MFLMWRGNKTIIKNQSQVWGWIGLAFFLICSRKMWTYLSKYVFSVNQIIFLSINWESCSIHFLTFCIFQNYQFTLHLSSFLKLPSIKFLPTNFLLYVCDFVLKHALGYLQNLIVLTITRKVQPDFMCIQVYPRNLRTKLTSYVQDSSFCVFE